MLKRKTVVAERKTKNKEINLKKIVIFTGFIRWNSLAGLMQLKFENVAEMKNMSV